MVGTALTASLPGLLRYWVSLSYKAIFKLN